MHISYVWILIAALIQWVLGILWYGVIFKKSWRKLVGLAEGEDQKNMILALVAGFVACVLLSFLMAHLFGTFGMRHYLGGFDVGVVCWLGFMAPVLLAQHVLEGRRANLYAINATYWLLAMGLGSAILAAHH